MLLRALARVFSEDLAVDLGTAHTLKCRILKVHGRSMDVFSVFLQVNMGRSLSQERKIYRGMTLPQAVFDALLQQRGEGDSLALEIPAEGQGIQIPYKGSVLAIVHRIRGHLQSAVSYAGEETLVAARAKGLPDPLRYLIPLSPAARTESDERRVRSVSTRE